MSSEISHEEIETEIMYEAVMEESSEEVPMDEWSSLIIEGPVENRKRLLYEQGLYKPDSGEICSKFIRMSDSSVFRHPYYNYPAVTDPGIEEALLAPEPKIIYSDDGQALYMELCKEMNQCPVKTFYKNLLADTIDLGFYCVNPYGVRAMAMALRYNRTVRTFILTDNFLNDDACFHLNEMLISNSTLKELILAGCRIGTTGTKHLFSDLHLNRGLRTLNLNRNQIGDAGLEVISAANFRGLDIKSLLLSYNNITGKSANIFAETLETYNKFTHIDLSYNNLSASVLGTITLIARLSESKFLQELNLSWNSLSGARIGTALKDIFRTPNLHVLNLSNNKLTGEGIQNFIGYMSKAKKMITLNLSYNPMTPEDAIKVLQKMKLNSVKLQNLLMENVFVDGEFLILLEYIKTLKIRKDTVITYGGVTGTFVPKGPDMRDIVLNRMEYLTTRGKKRKIDVSLVMMQMLKDNIDIMPAKSFVEAIELTEAPLDSDLLDEIVNTFPGPKSAKTKTISIRRVVDFINQKWPDKKLPPTPPPEPEPEPEPELEPAVPEPIKKTKGKA